MAATFAALAAPAASSSPAASFSSMPRARDSETGQRRRRAWSAQEDQVLFEALRAAKEAAGIANTADDAASADPETIAHISWAMVASRLPGRTAKDCRKRLVYSLDVNLRKGAWTEDEDRQLLKAMSEYANQRNCDMRKIKWAAIARAIGTRSGDQASKRWREVLNPALNRCEWSHDEDRRLLRLIDAHRCFDVAGEQLKGRSFSAAGCIALPPAPSDASHIRLDCSWNEIAKQHGSRTGLQVRNRYNLIKQFKAGCCSSEGVTASAAVPSSIFRLKSVRQNMHHAKVASFSSTVSSSRSSGASDDDNLASSHSSFFARKSSASNKRSRANSTCSASGSQVDGLSAAGYDVRGGLHSSAGVRAASYEVSSGTRNAWQSLPLFSTAGAAPSGREKRSAEGSSSPAQSATTTAAMQPSPRPWSSTVASGTLDSESLAPAASSGALPLPPSSSRLSTAVSPFSASVPASLDALTSVAWPGAPPEAFPDNELDDFYQSFVESSLPAAPVTKTLSLPLFPPAPAPLPPLEKATSRPSPWSQSSLLDGMAPSTLPQHEASSWASSGLESSSCDGTRRSSMSSGANAGDLALDAIAAPAAFRGLLKSGEAANPHTNHGQKQNIFGGVFVL